jgi:16S rRNA A1518/A1519 N6-dimethyltransferase RsmA/KsgA/DIM1 with predicted DNA glycosylase/AP lyase activity
MVQMADAKPGQKIADIGSGDGRILMAFARRGIEAHGYEINPLLVWRSRRAIRLAGLQNKAFVHWKDLWRISFSGFDTIVVYGIPYIMGGLENKLEREADPGTKVISNIYAFPHWKTIAVNKNIYMYKVGEHRQDQPKP